MYLKRKIPTAEKNKNFPSEHLSKYENDGKNDRKSNRNCQIRCSSLQSNINESMYEINE